MKNKLFAIAGVAIVIIILIVFIFFIFRDNNAVQEVVDTSSSEVTSSSSVDNSEVSAEEQSLLFEEIIIDGNTMQDYSSYEASKEAWFGLNTLEERPDIRPMVGTDGAIRSASGHTLYTDDAGLQYIISGDYVYKLSYNDVYIYPTLLRSEEDNKRIRYFSTASERDNYVASWNEGQSILNGEVQGEANSIILDGALTPYYYSGEGKNISVKMLEVLSFIYPNFFYDETSGMMNVLVNDYTTLSLVTDSAGYEVAEMLRADRMNFIFSSWAGEPFEVRIPLLDANDPEMTIENLAIVFGWRFYTDGNVLHIVTSEDNISGQAFMYSHPLDATQKTIIELIDGVEMVVTYNASGQVINSRPFIFDDTNTSNTEEEVEEEVEEPTDTTQENDNSSSSEPEQEDQSEEDNEEDTTTSESVELPRV